MAERFLVLTGRQKILEKTASSEVAEAEVEMVDQPGVLMSR